jgi:hypothetical protein
VVGYHEADTGVPDARYGGDPPKEGGTVKPSAIQSPAEMGDEGGRCMDLDRWTEHGDSDETDFPAESTDAPWTTDAGGTPLDETVELGVELLAHVEDDELPLPDAMDRIETVTTDPAVTREILDAAETRGVIDRDEATIRTRTRGVYVEFERQVVQREGDYECRRCGAGLSTGHFVQFDTGELGPFGSSCIRKVTGRE